MDGWIQRDVYNITPIYDVYNMRCWWHNVHTHDMHITSREPRVTRAWKRRDWIWSRALTTWRAFRVAPCYMTNKSRVFRKLVTAVPTWVWGCVWVGGCVYERVFWRWVSAVPRYARVCGCVCICRCICICMCMCVRAHLFFLPLSLTLSLSLSLSLSLFLSLSLSLLLYTLLITTATHCNTLLHTATHCNTQEVACYAA